MLQRLICALYRGHFWLNTRERDGVWLERTCVYCGKVRSNGQVPRIAMPYPRPYVRCMGCEGVYTGCARCNGAGYVLPPIPPPNRVIGDGELQPRPPRILQ